MEHLLAWKRQPKRKPLILMGARQVGKTFVLKQFGGQEYAATVYLNFEDNPRLCKLFDASLDPEMILKALTIEMDTEIVARTFTGERYLSVGKESSAPYRAFSFGGGFGSWKRNCQKQQVPM